MSCCTVLLGTELTVLAQEQADHAGVKGEGLFKRDNDESFSPDHQAEMVEVAVRVWNAEFGVRACNTPLSFFSRGGQTVFHSPYTTIGSTLRRRVVTTVTEL